MFIAVRTGLEPATPCVTGMYSNQAELPHLLYVLQIVLFLICGCKVTYFLSIMQYPLNVFYNFSSFRQNMINYMSQLINAIQLRL